MSFFESFIVRQLREQGCGDIWVIADSDGYRASLIESQSTSIGRDYRLVPARLDQGILHAKTAYLTSSDGDLLMVGSGNLTFGGYGRNLEILEVFDSAACPSVFSDYADFLEELADRTDFRVPEREWLTTFAGLARKPSSEANDEPERPRLISTVSISAGKQMANEVRSRGGATSVVVLSPFHDPDGSAVFRIAREIGADSLSVGIGPDADSTAFPFGLDRSKDVSCVVPSGAGVDSRKLHGKCFEIQTASGPLLLTGSVNATTKSLWTSHNIEVGVLRSGCTLEWVRSEPPQTSLSEVSKSEDQGHLLLHAVLHGDGQLNGQVLTNEDPSGSWKGAIRNGGDKECFVEVLVDGKGAFSASVEKPDSIMFSPGLQLDIVGPLGNARGWVQNHEALQLSRAGVNAGMLHRFISGIETEDDVLVLLNYLSASMAKHLPVFQRRFLAGQEKAAGNTDVLTIDLCELAPDVEGSSQSAHDGHGRVIDSVLDRVFARLRRRFLGNGVSPGQPGTSDTQEEDEVDQEVENAKKAESALNRFESKVMEFIERSRTPTELHALFCIWLEVSLHMRMRPRVDVSTTDFVMRWLKAVNVHCKSLDDVSSLEQHFITVLVLTPLMEDTITDSLMMHLSEMLESFYSGDPDPGRVRCALRSGAGTGFPELLAGSVDRVELIDTLDRIMGTKTIRKCLIEIIEAFDNEACPAEVPKVLDCPGGHELLRMWRLGRPSVIESAPGGTVCSACFMKLSHSATVNLEDRRLAKCENCGATIVRTTL